ncbi:MAG TPA: hypothetical protein DCG19_03825 [Cryomorphaceae bacterium]|nr:hypothetical protein [Owenweeksia sp.]MBF97863.1 hypothetical protein [Owenweeksia sp.]HAD96508.1 hypothetical protein [Cryomorphaceae bacterium]HBF19791.1 hypothetical protein [Cryomorphaceae bacterium]HCQ17123.1 hypothetical protein [Cryomorphaceae bacterium]|tara:strand:- start:12922 stop:14445 length:1524 start_codon:yes stop_codon:yes gene_type:complete
MDNNVNADLDIKYAVRGNGIIIITVHTGKKDVKDRISTGLKLPAGAKFDKGTCTESKLVEARQVAAKCRLLKNRIEKALEGKDVSSLEKLRAITGQFKNKGKRKPQSLSSTDNGDTVESFDAILLSKVLKEYLEQIGNGTIKTRKRLPFAEDTVRSYTLKIQNFLEYLEEMELDQPLSNFDLSRTRDSYKRIQIRDSYNDLFEGFYDYLADRDLKRRLDPGNKKLGVNSISAIIHKVKAGLTNRFDEYAFIQPKIKLSLPEEDADTIVLPVEMMEILFASDEIDPYKLSKPHERAYNYVLFALSTTSRGSDIYESTEQHLNEVNGEVEFQKLTRKTNVRVNSYLYPVVADLLKRNLKKYGDAFHPLGRNTTSRRSFVSNMSPTLKSFFKEFDCMHEIYKHEYRDPKTRDLIIEERPLYEMVSTHTMRRTSITYMQIMGMDDADIKRMSGHSKNSKSYEKYRRFVPSVFRNKVRKYVDWLSEGNLAGDAEKPSMLKVIRDIQDEKGAA